MTSTAAPSDTAPPAVRPAPATTQAPRERRANNFDLLRLVAAVCVVFAHSFNLLGTRDPFPPIAGMNWGFVGVLIFFSISGYLVAGSWARAPRLLEFAAKRALRLMPALVVSSLACALILGPLVTTLALRTYLDDPATKLYALHNSLLQSDYMLPGVFAHLPVPSAVNGSLWTLPLEVKAYALVAIIGLLVRSRWRPGVMALVTALTALATIDSLRASLPGASHFVATLVDIQANPALVYAAQQGRATEFALLFCAFCAGATLFAVRRWVPLRWDLALLMVVLWLGTVALGGLAPRTAAVVLAPYALLVIAGRTYGRVRLPRRMGDYSYGTYLYAFPIQQTLVLVLAPTSGWVLFGLSLPAALALGFLSWRFVEAPALALKPR